MAILLPLGSSQAWTFEDSNERRLVGFRIQRRSAVCFLGATNNYMFWDEWKENEICHKIVFFCMSVVTIAMAFLQTREFVWVDRSLRGFHKDEISIITIRTVRSELKKMHFAMLFFALFGCCFMFDGTEPNSLKHRELEQKPSLPRLPNDATIALKRRCMNWFSS